MYSAARVRRCRAARFPWPCVSLPFTPRGVQRGDSLALTCATISSKRSEAAMVFFKASSATGRPLMATVIFQRKVSPSLSRSAFSVEAWADLYRLCSRCARKAVSRRCREPLCQKEKKARPACRGSGEVSMRVQESASASARNMTALSGLRPVHISMLSGGLLDEQSPPRWRRGRPAGASRG